MEVPNKQEWTAAFNNIFAELSSKELPKSSYHSFEARDPLIYSPKGLATFRCSKCNRYWESQNGKIRFSYRLVIDRTTRLAKGDVNLAAFGQKCNRCPGTPYMPAKFESESMEDALRKLLLKVKEKHYGENVTRELGELEGKRHGEGRGEHDSSRCQACHLGVCSHNPENQGNPRKVFPDSIHYSGPTPANTRIKWVLRFGNSRSKNTLSSTTRNRSESRAQPASSGTNTEVRPQAIVTISNRQVSNPWHSDSTNRPQTSSETAVDLNFGEMNLWETTGTKHRRNIAPNSINNITERTKYSCEQCAKESRNYNKRGCP